MATGPESLFSAEYRLSWSGPADAWRCAAVEDTYGRDCWPRFSDEQWDEMLGDWRRTEVVFRDAERMGQYHTLKKWAETREQPIRDVRLEKREGRPADEGWEPAAPSRCALPDCPGLDMQDGMCPNGYGATCEALDV